MPAWRLSLHALTRTISPTKRFFEILGEQQVPVQELPEHLAEIATRSGTR